MPAYIHASVEVTDPVLYETYRAQAPAVIAAFGGRYLVRGGAVTALEGAAPTTRQVILEFPDMARLQAFYNSPQYRELVAIRLKAGRSTLVAIEGV